MSFSNPAYTIPRRNIHHHQAMWTKMWDPPTESPSTPDELAPTNPVPAFMEATLGRDTFRVNTPNTIELNLQSGMTLPTWDGLKELSFMTFRDDGLQSPWNNGHWPGPTVRVPRGAIFHCLSHGQGTPPHTIHWHGLEPTPMNDGVGHCSMEIGDYTYQLQPNFIGTYFYHCHRNTVQHFEFGLYGMFLVEPPDAFDGPNAGGYPRRTAASLKRFPKFPGFNSNPVNSLDPQAMTVPYDVEALWVFDDRDSRWSDLASHPRAFYPAHQNQPGVDDQFYHGFFHDFNPDYFFVTGQAIPAPMGGTADIPANLVIPPELNSGVSGMQVSVNAQTNQTILVRALNAAYANATVTFPVDVTIIAFDGRALGVPPFSRTNSAFRLRAGRPFELSTARRFDALIRSSTPVNDFATVEYSGTLNKSSMVTGRIPINIS